MSQQPDDTTEDEIEFDENDNKIIQLYEVINELIDEQKSRVQDIELLYQEKGTLVLQNVEDRNNSVLNQIYTELQLKETNDDDDDDDSDSDESEDEQDQGWEIYNTVVSNLNGYMGQIALFSQKLKEQREMIDKYGGGEEQEEEIKELENVVEAQTLALEQQMKRNEELERALSSVLNEYSNKLSVGNQEIQSLHEQLSITNKQHSKQIQELRAMYEKKIKELQQSQDSQYKQEVSQLIETLSSSRIDFQKQIVALTQEMSEAQTSHHHDMLKLTSYNQTLTEALAEKTLLVEDLKQKNFDQPNKFKQSLRKTRTELDIDDEEEFFYSNKSSSKSPKSPKSPNDGLSIDAKSNTLPIYNGSGGKKTRTFTPSQYTASVDNKQQSKQRQFTNNYTNGSNNNNNDSQKTSGSALQAKYAQYKTSSKGYKSRSNKNKYSQKTY